MGVGSSKNKKRVPENFAQVTPPGVMVSPPAVGSTQGSAISTGGMDSGQQAAADMPNVGTFRLDQPAAQTDRPHVTRFNLDGASATLPERDSTAVARAKRRGSPAPFSRGSDDDSPEPYTNTRTSNASSGGFGYTQRKSAQGIQAKLQNIALGGEDTGLYSREGSATSGESHTKPNTQKP